MDSLQNRCGLLLLQAGKAKNDVGVSDDATVKTLKVRFKQEQDSMRVLFGYIWLAHLPGRP